MKTWIVDVIDNANDRTWHYRIDADDAYSAKIAGLKKAGIQAGRGVEVFVTPA